MSCFSIHKSLLAAMLLLAMASFPANATSTQSAQKQKDAENEEVQGELSSAPIVIELFTMSDCSACVYADRMLYDAMKDKQVIALSCHITDSAAAGGDGTTSEESGPIDPCIFRQWAFGSKRSQEVELTVPSFYFNGKTRTSGDNLIRFNSLLRQLHYTGLNRTMEAMVLWKDKETVSIQLPQVLNTTTNISASVWLVRYKDMTVERMDHGVNKGRVLRFSNIVQDITHVGKWYGMPRVIDVNVAPPKGGTERGGYVVLVASKLGTEYMVAGKLEDYPVAADLKAQQEQRTSGAGPKDAN